MYVQINLTTRTPIKVVEVRTDSNGNKSLVLDLDDDKQIEQLSDLVDITQKSLDGYKELFGGGY